MDSTNFFVPSASLHDDPEQVKRQKSALRLDVQAIDTTTQTGKINKYDVSLTGCSCRDFQLRKKPCKHMYRLAHELGVFRLSGKVINDSSVQNDADKKTKKSQVVHCVSQLDDNEKSVLHSILYAYLYHQKAVSALPRASIPEHLFDLHLIVDTGLDMQALSDVSRLGALRNLIKEHQCNIKLRKKIDILQALAADYPEVFRLYASDFAFVIPSPDVLLAPRKVYQLVQPPQDDLSHLWM